MQIKRLDGTACKNLIVQLSLSKKIDTSQALCVPEAETLNTRHIFRNNQFFHRASLKSALTHGFQTFGKSNLPQALTICKGFLPNALHALADEYFSDFFTAAIASWRYLPDAKDQEKCILGVSLEFEYCCFRAMVQIEREAVLFSA